MAKKISQLTQATEVKSDDVTVIVQDGETKKLPLNMMVTKQDIENKKIAGLAKLDEIEATYENDTYTPTITVKNKSSVKTGEGDEVDYSANVMDGHVKSAILKGQTLVNLSNISSSDIISINNISFDISLRFKLKNLTTYTAIFNVVTLETPNDAWCGFMGNNGWGSATKTYKIGINKIAFTTYENSDCGRLRLRGTNNAFKNLIILEGDYTNVDIPYFEGMQSVKMPVLTTTGKNLWDKKNSIYDFEQGELEANGNEWDWTNASRSKQKIPCKGNTTYTLSSEFSQWKRVVYYDIDDKVISSSVEGGKFLTFTTPSNATHFRFRYQAPLSELLQYDIQLEYGSIATTYEPYKTNILTTPEDLELRGIGKVKDELNVATGELTERIGEIVLDGSEIWRLNKPLGDGSFYQFVANIVQAKKVAQQLVVCDKLVSAPNQSINNVIWIFNGTTMVIHSSCRNVDEMKTWLQQNPLTVQYELATPIIKTVDLMPSGTHPSTTPYCWKNGHIQLSSSGLLPNLEYSVVTSRAGQINQNATMIVKNDKRIFDLEILLAGGLVNTTYQALTLQNQVETGLSKVSLNSEKEPDYLLYHMIMKLIEEKAYKLDDLAEKVSVFYLYEKLSDEQFETIYSELYPFVEEEYIELPEDGEIIEEPVVDELPKEVEDEVVM
jgi:hypothetical protein